MQTILSTLVLLGSTFALPSVLHSRNGPLHTYGDSNQIDGRDLPEPHTYVTYESNNEKRAACNHDNLLRLFLDARYSSSASAFCSGYITATGTATEFQTATVTVTPAVAKRSATVAPPDNAITYEPSRLSSACSCLITAPAETTFIATSTVTVTTETVTATPTAVPGIYCGIMGYSKGLPGQNEQGAPVDSFDDCVGACRARDGCLSFAWMEGYCFTEQQDVKTLINGNDVTPWVWYDMSCPEAAI